MPGELIVLPPPPLPFVLLIGGATTYIRNCSTYMADAPLGIPYRIGFCSYPDRCNNLTNYTSTTTNTQSTWKTTTPMTQSSTESATLWCYACSGQGTSSDCAQSPEKNDQTSLVQCSAATPCYVFQNFTKGTNNTKIQLTMNFKMNIYGNLFSVDRNFGVHLSKLLRIKFH